MNKIITFIAVALFAATVSAQEIGRKPSNATKPRYHVNLPASKKVDNDKITIREGGRLLPDTKILKEYRMSTDELQTLRPVGVIQRQVNSLICTSIGHIVPQSSALSISDDCLTPALSAGRKSVTQQQAHTLKALSAVKKAQAEKVTYTGRGVDFETKADTSWSAYFSEAVKDGKTVPVFVNPAPNYFITYGVEAIAVEYTETDGVITIPAQPIYQLEDDGQTLYVIISSMATSDGSIVMTRDADGKLTTSSKETIMYGAWTKPEFDPTYRKVSKGGSYLGYYSYTNEVRYLLPGQEDEKETIDESGFRTILSYDVAGVSVKTGNTEKWSTLVGTRTVNNKMYNVIRNLIPNCFEADGIDYVDVAFTMQEPYLKVPAQTVMTTQSEIGTLYVKISNLNSADGSILLSLGNDSTLTVSDSCLIAYSLWTSPDYDPELQTVDNGGTLAGMYSAYQGLKFTLKGRNNGSTSGGNGGNSGNTGGSTGGNTGGSGSTGGTTTSSQIYNVLASVTTSESASNMKWNMELGTVTSGGKTAEVMRNPLPHTSDFNADTEVIFTRENGKLIVQPQLVAQNSRYSVFFSSGITDNGEFVLNIDEDGNITANPEEVILYSIWSSPSYDPNFGDTYLGYVCYAQSLRYAKDGETIAPKVMYQPETVTLHVGPSISGYHFSTNMAIAPADAEVRMLNTTSDYADSWNWKVSRLNEDSEGYMHYGDSVEYTSRNLSFVSEGGQVYAWPSLTGTNVDAVSAPYQWATPEDSFIPCIYAGGTGYDYSFPDGSTATVSKLNPGNEVTPIGVLGTPDVNTSGYEIHSIIAYQGVPSAPLYTEGIRLVCYSLKKHSNKGLTCRIVKASRDEDGNFSIGDVIAESKTWTASTDYYSMIDFTDFYVYDEYGLTRNVDHVFIGEEYAIMIDGWAEGAITAYPFLENSYNDNGMPNTSVDMIYEGSLRRLTFSFYNNLFIGYLGATYGYIRADEADKSIVLPGTESSRLVNVYPMIHDESISKGGVTRLYLDETSDYPDWLRISIDSEDYSIENKGRCTLRFSAKALPENVVRRTANIVLYQEGAQVRFTVTQDSRMQSNMNATAIEDVQSVSSGEAIYNLNGQRIAKQKNGVQIIGGRKFAIKNQTIK